MVNGTSAIGPDRVATYIRWSTEEQGDGTTLAEQREGCQLYIRSQGWAVNPSLEYIDDGFSGATLLRPAMERLRENIRAGLVDCVVVFKIDRLSRNIVDATRLVLEEWQGQCHLRCVRQSIDTTSETGRMLFAILATFADFERSQITERTYLGRLRRLREGRAYGGAHVPFGLRATGKPGERQHDPERAPIVRELYRRVAQEDARLVDLVRWLEAEGVPSPTGRRWRLNTVRHILTNPIYMGRVCYGRAGVDGLPATGGRRRRGEAPLLDVAATGVPTVVPAAQFQQVQAILARRAKPRDGRAGTTRQGHLLSGIGMCRCGARLQAHWSRGIRYYICGARVMAGRAACPAGGGTVRADLVEVAIGGEVLLLYDGLSEASEAIDRVSGTTVGIRGSDRGARVRRVERRLLALGQAAADGRVSVSEWRELKVPLEAERDRLRAVAAESNEAANPDALRRQMAGLHRWESLVVREQKSLLLALTERVTIFKPNGRGEPVELEVVWRFCSPNVGKTPQSSAE